MAFYDYLNVPNVVTLKSADKAQALKQLASALCNAVGIRKKKQLIDEIARREESASTFIGQGVALPQTRGYIEQDFAIAVGRSVAGVKYDAARGALAHIIVLIIVRDDTDKNQKVAILSELASFFKSKSIQEQLLSIEESVDIRSIIKSYTQSDANEKTGRPSRKTVDLIIEAAVSLVKELKAARLLVFADTVRENDFLNQIRLRNKPIIVASNKSRFEPDDNRIAAIINAPSFPASRIGQIKVGILLALSRGLVKKDDKVICLSGNSNNGIFDTIIALDIGIEYEFFFDNTKAILPPDVKPEVLERVLGFASEIALEGREGKPTGTIFILGDTNSVGAFVRQLIINPFRGYSEAERNVLDPGLDETIKEFAAIDGAFIITGDGIVLSAGSYLRPQTAQIESLPSGFGARHAASAGITACTNALAITVSESTGMVTLFKNGVIMMTLSKPVIQDKGMIRNVI